MARIFHLHDRTIAVALRQELGFLLSNRIPRRWLTLLAGWVFRIENRWLTAACIGLWRRFSSLDLSDARQQRFRSVHECFIRELKPGARPIEESRSVLVSPCDGIIGASGTVVDGQVLQCKGQGYSLQELLGDAALADYYRGGTYVTVRLTPADYHRFHAPDDCTLQRLTYFPGDTWNVNPVTLRKIERLFCRNERAALQCRMHQDDAVVTLVPVAAILVASIRLRCLDLRLHLRYRGPEMIELEQPLVRGEEVGWFEHGSTILVFAPAGYTLATDVEPGRRIRVGRPLVQRREAGKSD